MDAFAKMDIFFVVTTVAVVLITATILVICMYALRVVRVLEEIAVEAREVARDVREVSERAFDDVRSVRDRFAGVFHGLTALFGLASRRAERKSARRPSAKKTKNVSSEATNE